VTAKSTPCQKRAYKTSLTCFSRLSLLRPADTEVKFCMGKIVFSPNSRKAFIHAAFVSGPGHHFLKSIDFLVNFILRTNIHWYQWAIQI